MKMIMQKVLIYLLLNKMLIIKISLLKRNFPIKALDFIG